MIGNITAAKAALDRFRGTPAELDARPHVPFAAIPDHVVVTHVRDVRLGPLQPTALRQQESREREERDAALDSARGRRKTDESLRVRGVDEDAVVEIWIDDFIAARWEDERTLVVRSHAGDFRLSARDELPDGPPYRHELWIDNAGGYFHDHSVPLTNGDTFEYQGDPYYVTSVNRHEVPPLVFVVRR